MYLAKSPILYGRCGALHNLATCETVITECTYSPQTVTLLQTDVRVNTLQPPNPRGHSRDFPVFRQLVTPVTSLRHSLTIAANFAECPHLRGDYRFL